MYLNVSINYSSNLNCKFVMRFDYHDNLLKENEKPESLIWNIKKFSWTQKKENITHYNKSLKNLDYFKKE